METAPEELLKIDEGSKKPPTTRIKNGASARALAAKAIKDDEQRSRNRALVEGLVDGNPPYPDGKRKANGLSWTANLNFGEGEGIMDSSAVPYYSLFSGVEYYAETKTAFEKENPDHETWHGKIGCRFHNLLKRWAKFDWTMQNASMWMRLHGIGPCFFDRAGDWRPKALPTRAVLAPKKSPSCVDPETKYYVVRVPYTVVDLWERIKDEKAATKMGWNVSYVRKLLTKKHRPEGQSINEGYDWEKLQEELKNNDLYTSEVECDDIPCAHVLVKEFSGKVSHFIVTESDIELGETKEDGTPKADEEFLFKSPNRYENYNQALVVFFQTIGKGTWHSVRGIASKSFRHLEVSNRLKCRAVDGVFMKGSLILKPGTAGNVDKLQLMQVGPVTYIPAGAELQQLQMHGATEELLAVDRLLTNHLSNNLGMFQARSLSREDGRGEVPTAAQIQAQVAKESTLSNGQITLFYQTLDSLYAEMFRRAADPNTSDEEAKRFQRECVEDGVPKKALTKMEFVRANRVSGYGSPQMRKLTDQEMMPLVPMLPEQGKQNFLKDAIGAIKGADKVERYFPEQHVPTQDDSIAGLENTSIMQGELPILSSGQNDVVHLKIHVEHAEKTLVPLKEAMDAEQPIDPAQLQQAERYVQVMAAHCAEHLGRLEGDPTRKEVAQFFEKELKNLVSFDGELRAALIQAQREAELAAAEQEQATVLGALDQAKVASTMTDIENKRMKTANDMALKAQKQKHAERLKNIQAAEEIRRERALAANEPDDS